MRSAAAVLVLAGLGLAGEPAAAKEVAGIYTQATLDHWKYVLEPWVRALIQQDIDPGLEARERPARQQTVIEVSTLSVSQDPFEYYCDATGKKLVVPVLSVKFLYDLVAAHVWLETKGFEDQSLTYLVALKYQDRAAFPGGRYLSPFEALAIPHNGEMEILGDDISPEFQLMFNSALIFLLAHEMGHAVLPPAKQAVLQQEIAADAFANRILAARGVNPAGAAWFFMFATVWAQNASDFPTPEMYQQWLTQANHPLSGARVAGFGQRLAEQPRSFLPGAPAADQRIAMIKLTGEKLISLGRDMNNLAAQRAMQAVARDIRIASLAVHKKAG
jgi:hypothetical protein